MPAALSFATYASENVAAPNPGFPVQVVPEGFNARCRVHEYGGAAVLISGDLIVVSDFVTGRLNRVVAPERLEPLTPPDKAWRYADVIHDAAHNRLIAVREDHEDAMVASHGEWNNDLVAIDLATGAVSPIAEGSDFYAAPRLSPDGSTLVWLEWHHPNMPWDGTELHLANIAADGSLGPSRIVAGSRTDWISQPRWSPDGVLHFVAEPEGWMNIFRLVEGRTEPVTSFEAEFAGPDWQFGYVTYDFMAGGSILAIARSGGRDQLVKVRADGDLEPIDLPYSEIAGLSIDVEHGIAATREQLEARREPGECRGGRAAMAGHDEWRQLAGRTYE